VEQNLQKSAKKPPPTWWREKGIAIRNWWSNGWRAGLVIVIPVTIIFIIGRIVINVLADVGRWFGVTGIVAVDTTLVILLLVGGTFALGASLSYHSVRVALLKLTGWVPFVGMIFKIVLDPDYEEKVKEGIFLEVEFYENPGVKKIGIITNRMKEPESEQEGSPMVPWLIVIWLTVPLPATGLMFKIRKSEVVYTGRTAKDTLLTTVTLGFVYRKHVDDKK
jgi:uncharacterized membrane protein